jgi:hypothetical protein
VEAVERCFLPRQIQRGEWEERRDACCGARERERGVCGRVVGVGLLYTIITHFKLGVVGFVGVGLICSIITHSELLDYE